jgi:hypothetical protein
MQTVFPKRLTTQKLQHFLQRFCNGLCNRKGRRFGISGSPKAGAVEHIRPIPLGQSRGHVGRGGVETAGGETVGGIAGGDAQTRAGGIPTGSR